jgi:hypothetical protein
MDKKFLQSIGLEIGLPRWKAYLLCLAIVGVGSVIAYVGTVLFLATFS